MKELVGLLKAIADQNRLRILWLLKARKMCVCELACVLGITQPAVSKHLSKLAVFGIIASEQDHFWTNYYLRKDNKTCCEILSCLGKQLARDSVFMQDLKKLKKVNRILLCCRK